MNDNYKFFCDRVCSYIDHATAEERIHISRELCDHIDDHAQALMDLGRSKEEAETAALAAMGDPEEIGKELNKEYPFHWFFISRAAIVIALVLIVLMLSPVHTVISRASDNYEARNIASSISEARVDIRVSIPNTNDVVRIYAAELESNELGSHFVWISMCCYDRSWLGTAYNHTKDFYFLHNGVRYSSEDHFPMGSAAAYRSSRVFVDAGQEYVTAVYERLGEKIVVEIPLNWEGVA